MTTTPFDMDAALQALRDGKDLTGKDGPLCQASCHYLLI